MPGKWFEYVVEPAIWLTVLAALAAIAVYVVRKVRSEGEREGPASGQLLAKLREIHSQGGLSDEEFRTIKTSLDARLKRELNDTGETGYDG